ncbi:MAG: hypothetical protein ACREBU_07465 [Nitrososphaera sp.]
MSLAPRRASVPLDGVPYKAHATSLFSTEASRTRGTGKIRGGRGERRNPKFMRHGDHDTPMVTKHGTEAKLCRHKNGMFSIKRHTIIFHCRNCMATLVVAASRVTDYWIMLESKTTKQLRLDGKS